MHHCIKLPLEHCWGVGQYREPDKDSRWRQISRRGSGKLLEPTRSSFGHIRSQWQCCLLGMKMAVMSSSCIQLGISNRTLACRLARGLKLYFMLFLTQKPHITEMCCEHCTEKAQCRGILLCSMPHGASMVSQASFVVLHVDVC